MGNQLFRLIAGKVLALDNGMEHRFIAYELFKGSSFMNLGNIGSHLPYKIEYPSGKVIAYMPAGNVPIPLWEEKTDYYNPEFNFIVEDIKLDYILDGEFQSEQYFHHRLSEIDGWLKVEPIDVPDDVCVIGFRGGEFYVFPELGLPESYFSEGIARMRRINPNMKFEVHTDDPVLAKKFFPDYKIINDTGINWRSMRYAKHAIIANSSFYILPRLLRHRQSKPIDFVKGGAITIAPRYWARRNTKVWSRPDNYYKSFLYV